MRTRCDHCSTWFEQQPRGRTARYCSARCRVAANRAGRLPAVMTDRRAWCRHYGKRPFTVDGYPASSTDPGTWSTYTEARASHLGDGLGIMLGNGLACWDLDHCFDPLGVLEPWAQAVVDGARRVVWVERSLSGDGLHVFVRAAEGPGSRTGGIEFYSRARFIVVTGDRWAAKGAGRG